MWDIRSAKGALMVLDQYNGKAPSDNILGMYPSSLRKTCVSNKVIGTYHNFLSPYFFNPQKLKSV